MVILGPKGKKVTFTTKWNWLFWCPRESTLLAPRGAMREGPSAVPGLAGPEGGELRGRAVGCLTGSTPVHLLLFFEGVVTLLPWFKRKVKGRHDF